MTVLLLTIFADAYFTNRLSTTNLNHAPASVAFMGDLTKYHRQSLDLAQMTGFKRTPQVDGRGLVSPFSGWSSVFKEPAYYGYTAIINSYHERLVKVVEERALSVGERKIWFSPQALALPPSDGLFGSYVERWRTRKNAPLILHDVKEFKTEDTATPAMVSSLRSAEAMTPLEFQLLAYTPTRLEFRVVVPGDGWILVTDRWSRSWRATINENIVSVRPANFYYRALPVKTGPNLVKMSYAPVVVPITFALSWGTLLFVAALQFFPRRRRRDNDTKARDPVADNERPSAPRLAS